MITGVILLDQYGNDDIKQFFEIARYYYLDDTIRNKAKEVRKDVSKYFYGNRGGQVEQAE